RSDWPTLVKDIDYSLPKVSRRAIIKPTLCWRERRMDLYGERRWFLSYGSIGENLRPSLCIREYTETCSSRQPLAGSLGAVKYKLITIESFRPRRYVLFLHVSRLYPNYSSIERVRERNFEGRGRDFNRLINNLLKDWLDVHGE